MPDDISTRDPGARRTNCPICGRPTEAATRPFCSRRCADVDLHRWLGGVYRVPTDERPTDGGGRDPDERD